MQNSQEIYPFKWVFFGCVTRLIEPFVNFENNVEDQQELKNERIVMWSGMTIINFPQRFLNVLDLYNIYFIYMKYFRSPSTSFWFVLPLCDRECGALQNPMSTVEGNHREQ